MDSLAAAKVENSFARPTDCELFFSRAGLRWGISSVDRRVPGTLSRGSSWVEVGAASGCVKKHNLARPSSTGGSALSGFLASFPPAVAPPPENQRLPHRSKTSGCPTAQKPAVKPPLKNQRSNYLSKASGQASQW